MKFQIKIRFSIELRGNSKLSMTSCPPSSDSHVLQSARPRAVALASYIVVDKIIKNTVDFTRKDI